jgi:phenylpropionate dioxygenase-like ring-hydroxylating dioxygenase large terminal subunit
MSNFVKAPLPPMQLSDAVQQILSQLHESTKDVAEAITMPPEVYTSEDWFEFEKRAIWDREWICLGHTGLVPERGDYVSITVNDDPLLVIHDKEDKIRVISAACPHRGTVLGEERGNVKNTFACPMHAWTFDLTGKLCSAPEMESHASLEELQKDHCLPNLRTEIWNGFIFINLDGEAKPLAPRLKRLSAEIANHHLDEMGAVPTLDWPGNPWNWKYMHENAIEPYHTHYLHKGVHDFAPSKLATFAEWDEADDGAIFHPTGFLELDGNFTGTRKSLYPVIETLTENERKRVMFACILPNLFFAAVPDGLLYYLILPQGANDITLRVGFVYPKSTLALPDFYEILPKVVEGLSIYNDQDVVANKLVHRGLKSRFANRGRYAPKEKTLPQFNRWLIKRYQEYAASLQSTAKKSKTVA